jgi:hypothetical protein
MLPLQRAPLNQLPPHRHGSLVVAMACKDVLAACQLVMGHVLLADGAPTELEGRQVVSSEALRRLRCSSCDFTLAVVASAFAELQLSLLLLLAFTTCLSANTCVCLAGSRRSYRTSNVRRSTSSRTHDMVDGMAPIKVHHLADTAPRCSQHHTDLPNGHSVMVCSCTTSNRALSSAAWTTSEPNPANAHHAVMLQAIASCGCHVANIVTSAFFPAADR